MNLNDREPAFGMLYEVSIYSAKLFIYEQKNIGRIFEKMFCMIGGCIKIIEIQPKVDIYCGLIHQTVFKLDPRLF